MVERHTLSLWVVESLPQDLILSPITYNLGRAEIDFRMTREVLKLQYADDIVIFASGAMLQRVQELLQESLNLVDILYPI
jgi:hypothetical protein